MSWKYAVSLTIIGGLRHDPKGGHNGCGCEVRRRRSGLGQICFLQIS